ncbi:MAG: radical SAM protein [Bacillota bacterium]|nr:radical SAM protein [Bacillota bacterium]
MWKTLFSDINGKLYDAPGLGVVGRQGNSFVEPLEEEMIPLPEGATLTMIPERNPVAIDLEQDQFTAIKTNPYINSDKPVFAVGALLPQGYTRTLLPAFTGGKGKRPVPLLGYTLCGMKDGQIYVAAKQTDDNRKWNPAVYNKNIESLVDLKQEIFSENRIIKQLGLCAVEYGCFTAQNMFYQRWEAGIPVSPVCNASCIGCISEQPSECCPAPQRRLDFVPTVAEITDLVFYHLTRADEAIISFGQGCEGEPSLQADLVSQAIREVRSKTNLGTINMNTNAGYTKGIAKLCAAGIDSLRVSLNSPSPKLYQAYYQPKSYSFANVVESLKIAQQHGVFVSFNLLIFPGVNDREEELVALIKLVKDTGVKMIQLRNLNIDPDHYLELLPKAKSEPMGILNFLAAFKQELPEVLVGNYSKPLRQ